MDKMINNEISINETELNRILDLFIEKQIDNTKIGNVEIGISYKSEDREVIYIARDKKENTEGDEE